MAKEGQHIGKLGNAAEELAKQGKPEAVQEARRVINKHLDSLEDEAKRKKP